MNLNLLILLIIWQDESNEKEPEHLFYQILFYVFITMLDEPIFIYHKNILISEISFLHKAGYQHLIFLQFYLDARLTMDENDMPSSETPYVIFAYNRPSNLSAVLEALQDQSIEKLVVYIDGPKNESDFEQIEQCQEITKNIDWTEVETHFNKTNQGLVGLIKNIDEVFSRYSQAVFLEDDCIPMPAFNSFMNQALKEFESNPQVFSIGGYQPIELEYLESYKYSIVSSPRFLCWGWASWQDRWQMVSSYLPNYRSIAESIKDNIPSSGRDLVEIARAISSTRTQTWDIPVAIVTIYFGLSNLISTKGLVKNDGFNRGVHANNITKELANLHNRNLSAQMTETFRWPQHLEWDENYDRQLGEFVRKANQMSSSYRNVNQKLIHHVFNRLQTYKNAIISNTKNSMF